MKPVGDAGAASGSSRFGVNSIYLGWQNECSSDMQTAPSLMCICRARFLANSKSFASSNSQRAFMMFQYQPTRVVWQLITKCHVCWSAAGQFICQALQACTKLGHTIIVPVSCPRPFGICILAMSNPKCDVCRHVDCALAVLYGCLSHA